MPFVVTLQHPYSLHQQLHHKILYLTSDDTQKIQYLPERKILVIERPRITKFSSNKVNRVTIIDMPWWYKTWATQWLQSYPCKSKTSQDAQKSLMKFLEPTRKPKVIYTDNSWEFGKSCEESTTDRSETNGVAERAVRRVKEGTSAVLLQSNLDTEWWADSVEC